MDLRCVVLSAWYPRSVLSLERGFYFRF